MKVTLFIMNKRGLESLRWLIDNGYSYAIVRVYTSRDKAVVKDYFDEIVNLCRDNKIELIEGHSRYEIKTEYAFAIGWRWLINTDKKLIVLHDSILPSFKGWCPLVNSLVNGSEVIGVSAFMANDKMDEGGLVDVRSINISYPITIQQAIDQIIPLYHDSLKNIILSIERGTLVQYNAPSLSSYSMWLDEEDYRINWNWSSEKIRRFVDAKGFPYQGAESLENGHILKILECEEYDDVEVIDREQHIGKVINIVDGKWLVICGEGLLKLNKVYFNGKDTMDKLRVRLK